MIKRTAQKEIFTLCKQFKAVAVVGPRQSGKTTLTRHSFPDKHYVSLENPDTRAFAEEDPRGFLAQYKGGAILDEIQRCPHIFSYLQQILDETDENGRFILTGSNNFLLQQNIVQSLAGRVAYLYLLPLSVAELKSAGLLPATSNECLYNGGYPPVYSQRVSPEKWFTNYIKTYVERDVRLIKNISKLATFERFLKLCAGRTGQLLNKSNLGIEAGVDHKTIASWLSVLESSFIIHLLQPHYQNFNKRVVKMPKLYFYDTGLACALLGIQNKDQLATHPLRGSLFENFVICELKKSCYNRGISDNLYFWRDNKGHEIDGIIDKGDRLIPLEIKAGQTITSAYFKGLTYWNKLADNDNGFVVYAGEERQKRSSGTEVLPWSEIGNLASFLYPE